MSKICLTFHAHQPNRLIPYDFFKIGEHAFYEDDELNARVLNAVAERCYLPANRLMKQLIELSENQFKVSLALSGVILEQAEYHRPDLISSFRELAETGCVEFLAMPYYASLSSIYSPQEFAEQIEEHRRLIQRLFGQDTKVLYNTGMLYSNAIAAQCEDINLIGILADGNRSQIPGLNPNEVYLAPWVKKTVTLFRNTELSNDLAINRTNPEWQEYPLSPYTFADWLSNQQGSVVNLAMDYETLGERQSDATGVFEFWRTMIMAALDQENSFLTASEVCQQMKPISTCECNQNISCSTSGTMEQWSGNVLQNEAIGKIYKLEAAVKASNDADLIHVWRKLQSADHFQYMHMENSFTPYPSPYDGYIYFMNALADLQIRVKRIAEQQAMQKGMRLA